MQYCLEIVALPLEREPPPLSAVAALAARLSGRETLRVTLLPGAPCRVYAELPSLTLLAQARLELASRGFLVKEAPAPTVGSAELLLCRRVDRLALPVAGQTPVFSEFPAEPVSCGRTLSFTLNHIQNCGLTMLLRRSDGLDAATLKRLGALSADADALVRELSRGSQVFDVAIGVCGANAGLLAAEAAFACGALRVRKPDRPVPVGELPEAVRRMTQPLEHTFCLRELSCLTELGGFLPDAMQANPDTVCGAPFPLPPPSAPALRLGFTADGRVVEIPLRLLRQHLFLAGAPGSGKSNLLFGLAYQLENAGIPFLIIESAKEEFHHLGRVIPDLRVWRPTEGEYVFSPFTLPEGMTLSDYRASLLQMLRAGFDLDGPLEELFSDTLNRCFGRFGYSDASTAADGKPFGVSEFMEEFKTLLNEGGYSERVKSDLRTAGLVRLKKLPEQNPAVFDSALSVPVSELTRGSNLLQLSGLTTVEAKQSFATLLLISLSAYLRSGMKHAGDVPLRFAVIMDESHNLLRGLTDSHGEAYRFAEDFQNLLLELRSLGVGFLVADQSAHNVPEGIPSVCAAKVFMGGALSSGVEDYTAALGLDETALRNLYRLDAGEGLCSLPGLPHAVYFRSPNMIDCFSLEKPIERRNDYLQKHPRLTIETYPECAACPRRGKCTKEEKRDARYRSSELYRIYGAELEQALTRPEKDAEAKKARELRIEARLLSDALAAGNEVCTLTQFARRFRRERGGRIEAKELLRKADVLRASRGGKDEKETGKNGI